MDDGSQYQDHVQGRESQGSKRQQHMYQKNQSSNLAQNSSQKNKQGADLLFGASKRQPAKGSKFDKKGGPGGSCSNLSA